MIRWKYKDKNYYFDHMPAIGILAFIFGAPILVAWANDYSLNYLSIWNIIPLFLAGYLIYRNCTVSYEPHYYDEKGKKILGEKPK